MGPLAELGQELERRWGNHQVLGWALREEPQMEGEVVEGCQPGMVRVPRGLGRAQQGLERHLLKES